MKTIRNLWMVLVCAFCTLSVLCLVGGTAAAQVSIFCYHEIEKPSDPFAIPQKQLEQQIKDLKAQGYRFVSLAEYEAYMKGELALPEKSVMLTFDDGYASVYTQVYPLLKKYHVPAMIALVTSWTEGEGKPSDVGELLTWDEIRDLKRRGHEIASHTASHPSLTQLLAEGKRAAAMDELVRSRDAIAKETGAAPRFLCHPYIAWNDEVDALIRAAGVRPYGPVGYNHGKGTKAGTRPGVGD